MFFIRLLTLVINTVHVKYRISMPLMTEKPVGSPIVPPIADNMSTNFAALSLVITSIVGVLKYILIYRSVLFHPNP